MAKFGSFAFSWLSFTIFMIFSWSNAIDHEEDRKVHIVYLGSLVNVEQQYDSPLSYHGSILKQVLFEGNSMDNVLVASYSRSFNGFAAKLTDQEKDKLVRMKGVVSVFPSRTLHPQTTHSWDFMGFHQKVNRNLTIEKDVIVGVIDTGIWPESESFIDDGFGPPPQKWKGSCEGGNNFTCNNKIIGARYYPKSTPGIDSARDNQGHGTHTASTAAGNQVMNASFYGLAQGTARGGVPSARIAAYKVCHPHLGCNDTDILAAFDDAIADGVDIISISVGPDSAEEFKRDTIAIGAFHAMEKGILTVQSAGNAGPQQGTTISLAPWLLSVAASSIDRRIVDKVVLGDGNNTKLVGDSINSFTLNGTKLPLIFGEDASTSCSPGSVGLCLGDLCLDGSLVKGKIVSCLYPGGILEAYTAGAAGAVTCRTTENVSYVLPMPASTLSFSDYEFITNYMNSTKSPIAEILRSEKIKDTNAPFVAEFSSRGPNAIIPEILKPDISAPGVEILAAYSPIVSPSVSPEDKRSVKYNIVSGTSMACPHVSGAAAYIKSFHPDWSPSAIKSALMTTALPMNSTSAFIAKEYESGVGFLNPVQAVSPGLVYEVFKEDYIQLLCSIKEIDTPTLRLISGDNSSCPFTNFTDLNYPSMAIHLLPMEPFAVKFTRTVRNVGVANSTYKVSVFPDSHLNITVVPQVLSFDSLNEKKSFTVTVAGGKIRDETMLSSSLVWSDGNHTVRSPIVVYVISSDYYY